MCKRTALHMFRFGFLGFGMCGFSVWHDRFALGSGFRVRDLCLGDCY